MKGQLALTQPTRKVNTRGMTQRQRAAWRWARYFGTFKTNSFAMQLGYKDPYHALRRLIDRGLVERVGKGVYKGVSPGERRK